MKKIIARGAAIGEGQLHQLPRDHTMRSNNAHTIASDLRFQQCTAAFYRHLPATP